MLFDDPDATFAEFWAKYPRKVSKGAARRAWTTALKRAPASTIIEGLTRYKFHELKEKQPHASTWLNGWRWDDWKDEQDLTADPWGLRTWYDAEDAKPRPKGKFYATGYEFTAYEEIMWATGIDETWRGDLDTLGKWIIDGYRYDSIRDVIIEARRNNPAVPKRLEYLDRLVRHRALRWDFQRHEWRRER